MGVAPLVVRVLGVLAEPVLSVTPVCHALGPFPLARQAANNRSMPAVLFFQVAEVFHGRHDGPQHAWILLQQLDTRLQDRRVALLGPPGTLTSLPFACTARTPDPAHAPAA